MYIIGLLESVKFEFYRRFVSPYEDIKIEENGDVKENGDVYYNMIIYKSILIVIKMAKGYSELYKNSLTSFLINLVKVKSYFSTITRIKKEFENLSTQESSKIIISELSSCESELFSDNYDIVYTKTLFSGLLPLQDVPNKDTCIKHIRLIYAYSVGIQNPSKGEALLKNIKSIKETKLVKMPAKGPDVADLPPIIKSLVKDVIGDMDLSKLNLENPMMLMSMLPSILNKAETLPEKLKNIDPEKFGKEVAQLLKTFQELN